MDDRLVQQLEAELAAERKRPHARPPGADHVTFPGVGLRRAHLRRSPPFHLGDAWDVREVDEGLVLYHSEVSHRSGWLLDYVRVPMPSDELAKVVSELQNLVLPVRPWRNDQAGLDGTSFQVGVFGDMYSEVRFSWWEDPPPAWKPLASLAKKLFKQFAAARRDA